MNRSSIFEFSEPVSIWKILVLPKNLKLSKIDFIGILKLQLKKQASKQAGLGDVLGQTTSPWAGPVHGWAGLGSNPLFEKNQPMARPTRYSFTLKRISFVHRVYDSCINVAD